MALRTVMRLTLAQMRAMRDPPTQGSQAVAETPEPTDMIYYLTAHTTCICCRDFNYKSPSALHALAPPFYKPFPPTTIAPWRHQLQHHRLETWQPFPLDVGRRR